MTRTIISMLIVVLGLSLMALSSCQSREEESEGTVQYDNSDTTTPERSVVEYPNEDVAIQYSSEHSVVQYSNETTKLPDTGGIRF